MLRSSSISLKALFKNLPRGTIFGGILVAALLAFEMFNYSTTDFALTDVLGNDLKFAGMRWATILSIAFCGIDFAGIARLFTPEQGRDEPAEVWYLFGAWLLAAAMNACLTWWGISVAVTSHSIQGSSLVSSATLIKAVPVFVAIMVWLIRVLIIGTFSMAGERIFSMGTRPTRSSYSQTSRSTTTARPSFTTPRPASRPFDRTPWPDHQGGQERPTSAISASQRGEPTYHPLGASARGNDSSGNIRR